MRGFCSWKWMSGLLLAFLFHMPIAAAQTVGVDGRVLTAEQAGDVSEWVEIARHTAAHGEYSLIVRANFINIYPNAVMYGTTVYGDPAWQYTGFGNQTTYTTSVVNTRINNWFNGLAPGAADKLPMDARLRYFTMQHNALQRIGTCNTEASLTNGLSEPHRWPSGIGTDVAFVLSWAESANFLSKIQFWRHSNIANKPSPAHAIANYNKINIPKGWVCFMWLRSPGDVGQTAGALGNNDGSLGGRVFQMHLPATSTEQGYIYPALWVNSRIFDPVSPQPPPSAQPLPEGTLGLDNPLTGGCAATAGMPLGFLALAGLWTVARRRKP